MGQSESVFKGWSGPWPTIFKRADYGVVCHYRPGKSSGDRKSTRLNSSHLGISYAVFCLKKNIGTPWGRGRWGRDPRDYPSRESPLRRSCSRWANFFFKVRAPPEIYTFPLRDAFPI